MTLFSRFPGIDTQSLAANWLIFLWVIARLPREHATMRSAAKAALLGAVPLMGARNGQGQIQQHPSVEGQLVDRLRLHYLADSGVFGEPNGMLDG